MNITKELFEQLYLVENLSLGDIAKKLDISKSSCKRCADKFQLHKENAHLGKKSSIKNKIACNNGTKVIFIDKDSALPDCDKSKFSGDTYIKLGFKQMHKAKPSKHWYNIKLKKHITDNLLRQHGFDQLFNTNYGKFTSNDLLMIKNNFLEVYDAGQQAYIYVSENVD